jgi:hypothetical protein
MSKSFEDIYRGINYDLINHYNQGVSDERNRIIKLLEEVSLDYPPIDDVIATIKGEPNDNNG